MIDDKLMYSLYQFVTASHLSYVYFILSGYFIFVVYKLHEYSCGIFESDALATSHLQPQGWRFRLLGRYAS